LPTITSTAATVTPTGITAPSFADILAFFISKYQGIFGADIYLGPDTQDGQFLSVIASAINDSNSVAIAIYNAFSPATAQGVNLSSMVKINGLARAVSSFSTCDILLTGVAGTTVSNGVLSDTQGVKWNLPASVTIPPAGQVTATATCAVAGSVTALANSITGILTPTRGLQSVNNPSQSSPGEPVEDDAALRVRQAASVSIPSLTILDGVVAAVSAVTNVSRVKPYENDTATADAMGIPAHAISLVVEGGDADAIAAAIALRKTPGTPTYGTTVKTVTDQYGTRTIKFYRPTDVAISVTVTLIALAGYSTPVATAIQQAVVDYISDLGIGQQVRRTRLFTPANLYGVADSLTYEIESIQIASGSGTLGDTDIAIAFNQLATCQLSDVTITVAT
jgi:uncharacterized phage protein gp47/JayE